jgi:hypothetical protein
MRIEWWIHQIDFSPAGEDLHGEDLPETSSVRHGSAGGVVVIVGRAARSGADAGALGFVVLVATFEPLGVGVDEREDRLLAALDGVRGVGQGEARV